MTLCITAAKGGVGKTTFAVNLAVTLGVMGYDTLLIDANEGYRNADRLLGFDDVIVYDYGDVGNGMQFGDVAVRGRNPMYRELYFLPCPQNLAYGYDMMDTLLELVKERNGRHDFIIIDAHSFEDRRLLEASDTALLISTPTKQSLRNTEKYLCDCPSDISFMCVLNMFNMKHKSTLSDTMWEFLQVLAIPMLGVIPYDASLPLDEDNGVPHVCAHKDLVTSAYRNIARRLRGEKVGILDNKG